MNLNEQEMYQEIKVENIKCDGCATTIKKKILTDEKVSAVEVDIESGMIKIEVMEGALGDYSAVLLKMGYPESGTAEGIAAAKAKAKSFVSCAVGKVDNMVNK